MNQMRVARLASHALTALLVTAAGQQSLANELLFTIPDNLEFGNIDIFLTSGTATTATVTNRNGSFSQMVAIPAGGTAIVTVPDAQPIGALAVPTDQGFSITSPDPIAAYLMDANVPVASNDITNLFPTASLGTQYRVMAATSNLVTSGSQASFVATEDNTTVTITPSAALTTGQAAGVPFQMNLNRLQSVELRATGTGDLTGTSIVADRKIGVFGGHLCGNVPPGAAFCDHLIEQMPSTGNFGTNFVVLPTKQAGPGDVIKVLALQDGTQVTVTKSGEAPSVFNLNAGQSFTSDPAFNVNASVTSNSPVLLGQFMIGQTIAGDGDPAFSLVPDVTQWLSDYIFNVPAGNYNDFLGVAIVESALSSLTLDGALIDPLLFSAVPGGAFLAGNIPVTDGSHRITASSPFMLLGHGFNNNFASYFGIGGSAISGGGFEPPVIPEEPPSSVVSEPPGLAALAAGFLGLAFQMRRRRRR